LCIHLTALSTFGWKQMHQINILIKKVVQIILKWLRNLKKILGFFFRFFLCIFGVILLSKELILGKQNNQNNVWTRFFKMLRDSLNFNDSIFNLVQVVNFNRINRDIEEYMCKYPYSNLAMLLELFLCKKSNKRHL
jgi:hypothetical protein